MGAPIRILLVGESNSAGGARCLLDSEGPVQFQCTHVTGLELAAERLSDLPFDILLLDLGTQRQHGRAFIQAARAAAPDIPMVVLSETEDEGLAIEALQNGVQDLLSKETLDRAALARSLRYSIERHRLQKMLQSLTLSDDLTGLHDRRGFLALAEHHLR